MFKECGFPFYIEQGANFIQPIYYYDQNNSPIDLTGCIVEMMARKTVTAGDPPYVSWSSETGQIEIDGLVGGVLINVAASETADLDAGWEGVYDILITFPSGVVQRWLSGSFTVLGAVTR